MSHLRQPPFWRIFLIHPGFFPRGNASRILVKKSPIFLGTQPHPPKGRQSKKENNFTPFSSLQNDESALVTESFESGPFLS